MINKFNNEFYMFAMIGFIVATLSPPLGRDEVDFWYYTLGLVGIVLLFYSQIPIRADLKEQFFIDQLRTEIRTLHNLNESLVHSITNNNKISVINQLSDRFNDSRIILEENRYECLQKSRNNTHECNEIKHYSYIAKELTEEITLEKKISGYEYNQISNIFGNLIQDISVDGVLLPANLVAGLFMLQPNSAEAEIKEYLQSKIRSLENLLDFKTMESTNLNNNFSFISLKLFLITLWPYILCAALCLKIARLSILRSLKDGYSLMGDL